MKLPDKDRKKNTIENIFIQLGLVAAASVFFALSFPNPVFSKGLPFLAYFSLFPVVLLLKKCSFPVCMGWGIIYGCLSYALFNYWLSTFHPLAGVFVYSLYAFYMAVVFLLFKLADKLYPKHGYIVQWTIWIAYEFLRTKGFLGYPYGIIGYSQWQFIPLIQIAGITGIWGVSAIVSFPSFILSKILTQRAQWRADENLKEFFISSAFLRVLCVYLIIFVVSLIYGFAKDKDFSELPQANIALIQHNTDPWLASRAPTSEQRRFLYRKDLSTLIKLSDKALASEPKPQLVVWPETAFIPRIYWHTTYREDQDSWLIVKELLDYLQMQNVPFLTGNNDGRKDARGSRIDYNAAMLYEKGQNTGIYRKMHLVPFTEHFPYKKQFPFLHKALVKLEPNFYEKGTENTIFNLTDGFSFSAPICFEDSFGYLSRNFVMEGAEVLINLSNDAWSDSLSAQNQHLSMAVFRAVENSRSMVRATVSGQTCAINPSGRIIAQIPAFSEGYLNAQVPISGNSALYTLYGDYLAYMFIFAAFFLLIFKIIWCIIKK